MIAFEPEDKLLSFIYCKLFSIILEKPIIKFIIFQKRRASRAAQTPAGPAARQPPPPLPAPPPNADANAPNPDANAPTNDDPNAPTNADPNAQTNANPNDAPPAPADSDNEL